MLCMAEHTFLKPQPLPRILFCYGMSMKRSEVFSSLAPILLFCFVFFFCDLFWGLFLFGFVINKIRAMQTSFLNYCPRPQMSYWKMGFVYWQLSYIFTLQKTFPWEDVSFQVTFITAMVCCFLAAISIAACCEGCFTDWLYEEFWASGSPTVLLLTKFFFNIDSLYWSLFFVCVHRIFKEWIYLGLRTQYLSRICIFCSKWVSMEIERLLLWLLLRMYLVFMYFSFFKLTLNIALY